jgi:hypothetical protein
MLAMKERVLRLVCYGLVMGVLLWPAAAMAADDEGPRIDARVQNFQKVVSVQEGGTALTWLLLIFLTLICLAALFKNAKRTHLD